MKVVLVDGNTNMGSGEFAEIDAPRKLVMTRRFEKHPLQGTHETTITYRLDPLPNGSVTVRIPPQYLPKVHPQARCTSPPEQSPRLGNRHACPDEKQVIPLGARSWLTAGHCVHRPWRARIPAQMRTGTRARRTLVLP